MSNITINRLVMSKKEMYGKSWL